MKRKDILRAFYRGCMKGLGLDPDKKYGRSRPPVRISYPENGSPDWDIDEDVIFLWVDDVSGDDTTQPVHEEYTPEGDALMRRHWQNRVLRLSLTAYGPDAYDNLLVLRHRILDGIDVLRRADLLAVPSAEMPRYAPELFNARWWPRADLAIDFNHTTAWDEPVDPIEHVPVTVKVNPGAGFTVVESSELVGVEGAEDPGGIIIKKG